MDEGETRQELIDQRLRLAGWDVADPSQVTQELGILREAAAPATYAGHEFADYGLLLDSKPIAVVEAKRVSRSPEIGREQSFQYAANIGKSQGSAVPFLFYTNGRRIKFWEHDFYPPAEVYGFPARDDLEWMAERARQRKPLSVELIDTRIAGRDYQIAAIRAVLEAIEAKKRRVLLVMATGTGKTRVATALIDVLRRAKWIKRALFLVDRILLRDQAIEAFEDLIPAEPRWPNRHEAAFSRNRRLYVATYPTILNLIQNGTTPDTYLSPFFFDLVIADESHRSIYDVYKQVVDYFHGLRLGLTATPTDRIDHDTFRLFDCEANDPTFAYSFAEAIEHIPPYLSDFEVLKVRSKFQLEGIQGGTLPAAVQRRLFAEGIDPEDIDFEGTDLERKVTNAGTNALIVREFMEEAIKDPTGTLPGKSIIFAISISHARRLEDLFDRLYPEHAGKLARVIVSEDPRAYGKGGLLDQFKNQDMPRIAISVDMLDTGVDILEVVNLVFAKPVYSYTKFWQMIGRGTRVLHADPAKRRPWCTAKDRFLIIDCWGNFEFFQMNPAGKEPSAQVPLPVRLFQARLDELEAATASGDSDLATLVKLDLRQDLADLPKNNIAVIDASESLAETEKNAFWEALSARDVGFLRLMIAPVLRTRSAADSKGMRFQTETVEASTALLRGEAVKIEAIRESLIAQAAELPLTLTVVAKERPFIEDVLGSHWWLDLSHLKLRELAGRLVPLMRYRQPRADGMVHLDIADLTVIKGTIEFGPSHAHLTTRAYRERVEEAVHGLLAVNPVLQKIYAGGEVSEAEIEELAALLNSRDPFVTEELLRKAYDHRSARFTQFIKHILGLERLESWLETVTRRFDEFIAEHNTFSAMQVRFLQTLRTFILQNRRLEKKDLVEAPFTRIHPDGIRGVFRAGEIEEILSLSRSLVA